MSNQKPKPKKADPNKTRDEALAAARNRAMPPEIWSAASLRKMGIRIGIPLVALWAVALFTPYLWLKIAAGVITVALAVLIFFIARFASKGRAVAQIVRDADSAESRKEAISKLETDFKKGDAAAAIAKAQLQMQDDPRQALGTLEKVDLAKVLANTADEVRSQRAMIHLMFGEIEEARGLVEKIDLGRHKDAKAKATLASIVGEAFARTGAAKKAIDLLETFDPDDDLYKDIRLQLLRARAFAYAWGNNSKQMKQALRKMAGENAQALGGFITKKKHPAGVSPRGVHPMLEKEAFELFSRSGFVPRKMEFRRG